MKILLIRHGESTANVKGVAGTSDATLTENGKVQAKITAERLRAHNVTTIVSSPYTRAQQTAKIIATVLDIPPDNIITLDLLRERFLGKFEGTTGHPPEFFLNADDEGNIESRQALTKRVKDALVRLKSITEHRGGTTIAISHGQFSYYMIQVARGKITFEEFEPPSEISNAEFVELWRKEL